MKPHPSAAWAKSIIERQDILLLDTETTGLDDDSEVIDIALIDLAGNTLLDTLVQCQVEEVPAGARAVHGINKAKLAQAPDFPKVWKQLEALIQTHELVIYNAEFDTRIVGQTANRYNIRPGITTHCLMTKFSTFIGEPAPYYEDGYKYQSLATACRYFRIKRLKAHRALTDALMALMVLRKLAELAKE